MTERESHNEEPKSTVKTAAKNGKNPLPWIAGAILVLGLAIVAGFYWSSTMTVHQIRFKGNHFVSTANLKKVDVPLGMNPDSMDFGQIMKRFEQIPYVKQADISVEPSGNLLINIKERQPIAMLVDGNQKIFVDEDGVRLPLKLKSSVDVPILYGFSAKPIGDTISSKGYKTVAEFLKEVKERPVSNATISEVAWTKDEGVVAVTNQNSVKLIFGNGGFDKRLRNWEAFYGQVVKEKGIKKMRSIDLRFEGQIVTREK
ncbi:MAG TPA: cell division protein FtsQ/DivIB [Balneolaceae bacterium]|nr:cell division protein FtsQ/DivIB [Balneolaceae bacterium]